MYMQKIEFELPLDVQGTPFQKRVCRRLLRLLQACSFFHGLHELRLSGKSGEFRVFYLIKVGEAIYIIHAGSVYNFV